MAKYKPKINTTNKEIYEKFNMLNFSSEVMLKNTKSHHIDAILKNINTNKNILESEQIGNYFLIRKLNPINYNVYYKSKKASKQGKLNE